VSVIVLNSSLYLADGLLNQFKRLGPMSSLVVCGTLEILFRLSQVVHRSRHLWLRLVVATLIPFPPAMPRLVAPLTGAPATKLAAVNDAVFPIFKQTLLASRVTRVNAQCLYMSRVRIYAKGAVAHPDRTVLTCEFLQFLSYVYVMFGGAVLRADDQVLSRVTRPRKLRLESKWRQDPCRKQSNMQMTIQHEQTPFLGLGLRSNH